MKTKYHSFHAKFNAANPKFHLSAWNNRVDKDTDSPREMTRI